MVSDVMMSVSPVKVGQIYRRAVWVKEVRVEVTAPPVAAAQYCVVKTSENKPLLLFL